MHDDAGVGAQREHLAGDVQAAHEVPEPAPVVRLEDDRRAGARAHRRPPTASRAASSRAAVAPTAAGCDAVLRREERGVVQVRGEQVPGEPVPVEPAAEHLLVAAEVGLGGEGVRRVGGDAVGERGDVEGEARRRTSRGRGTGRRGARGRGR